MLGAQNKKADLGRLLWSRIKLQFVNRRISLRITQIYPSCLITCNPLIFLVERRRIELPTFALRTRRSPS